MNKISILLKSLLYNKYKFNQKFDFKTNNNYLVTTELGIIYISSKKFRFLTRFPGYGLTVNKNTVYFSYEDGKWEKKKYKTFSRVISAQLSDLINGKFLCKSTLYNQEEIYIQFFSSNNGRIHQVSYSPENNGKDHIIISASNENCIVKYNLYSKKYTKIFPFLDKFDVPIKNFDHNHINSAIKIGNTIYFVAYKAGSSSLIGYLKDAHVYGWQVFMIFILQRQVFYHVIHLVMLSMAEFYPSKVIYAPISLKKMISRLEVLLEMSRNYLLGTLIKVLEVNGLRGEVVL